MAIRPLPSVQEVISEVRREESRKKVTFESENPSLPNSNESLALVTRNTNFLPDNRARRGGRPWCEHCKNLVTPNKAVGTFMESHLIGNHEKVVDIQLLDKDNQSERSTHSVRNNWKFFRKCSVRPLITHTQLYLSQIQGKPMSKLVL